jgi:hypothetical protein
MILTPAQEPVAAPWRAEPLDAVAGVLRTGLADTGTRIIAVDGRSASGKSTFAEQLAAFLPGAGIVHTDDVAWWESFFGWDDLMADGVLAPVRRGDDVRFRPPAWQERGREGAIEVPAGAAFVILEGVGASRLSLRRFIDAAVWVQSDHAEAHRRGIARDLAERPDVAEAEAFWAQWSAQEDAFLADDRPWGRADVVVCGTPSLADVDYDAATDVVVGRSLAT